MSSHFLAGRLGGIGTAFSDRNFRFFSIGSIATWIGFFVQLVAVSWYAWELTGATEWLAVIALLDIVPNVVLMPLAGAVADRVDKYRMMGVVSLLALVQAVVLAVLAWQGQLGIWALAALVLLHGIIISFMVPAMYGILPRFVDRAVLTSAIAVNSSYSQLAVFLGPALAGWIITSFGVVAAFALNALAYLVYLVSWSFLRTPSDFEAPQPSGESMLRDIVAGFAYIRRHRGISSMLVLIFFGDALAASVFYMAPAFAEQILGMGVIGVSIILAARGVGATMAAVWIAWAGERAATVERLLRGFLLFLAAMFIAYLAGNVYLVAAAFVLMGLAGETYNTILTALTQLTVTEEQRGRVMGTLFMIVQLASGVGTYLVGYLAVRHGLVMPTLAAAAGCLLVWCSYYVRRRRIARDFASGR